MSFPGSLYSLTRRHSVLAPLLGVAAIATLGGAVLFISISRHDTSGVTSSFNAAPTKAGSQHSPASLQSTRQNNENTGQPGTATGGHNAPAVSGTTNATIGSKTSGSLMTAQVMQLVAAPGSVALYVTSGSATFDVATTLHTSFAQPKISYSSDLYAFVAGPNPPVSFAGGVWLQPTWHIGVRQTNFNATGRGSVTVTMIGGQSVTVPVSYKPVPSFSIVRGSLVRTDGTYTISYTASFTLTPVNWLYGNPTLSMRLYDTTACTNAADLTRTVLYSGQNTFSMTCVVNRLAPYVPGSGPPPPLPSNLNFSIDVAAQLPDGSYITGEQPFGYTAPAPYNQ